MPSYLHPGVYVEEIPSGSKPIEGVSTSVTAFVGQANRGTVGEPVFIGKLDDYINEFGRIADENDTMGFAVLAFYLNGGKGAYICRLADGTPVTAAVDLDGAQVDDTVVSPIMRVSASSPGVTANDFFVVIANANSTTRTFDLLVGTHDTDNVFSAIDNESFTGLSMDSTNENFVESRLASDSSLVRVAVTAGIPADATPTDTASDGVSLSATVSGSATVSAAVDLNGTQANATVVSPIMRVSASSPGDWANDYFVVIANANSTARTFDLLVGIQDTDNVFSAIDTESFTGLSMDSTNENFVERRLESESSLVRVAVTASIPADATPTDTAVGGVSLSSISGGATPPINTDYSSFYNATLRKYRDVSIIVLPGEQWASDGSGNAIVSTTQAFCETHKRAMLIIDPPSEHVLDTAVKVDAMGLPTSTYTALYYPWVEMANPLYNEDTNPLAPKTVAIAPSAVAAGLWAKIDGKRGVWKAPAGVEAQVVGISGLQDQVDDLEQGQLNPLGVNCIRKLPSYGSVIWGARTLATKADPEWRYTPVRRTAIMIEQSIYNGIQWAVFEPNAHPLWGSLRANIDGFMNGLFRSNAFQGAAAKDAYFVRCGLGDTMTQGDIDRGQVIVIVGFAPVKPAEFVIVRIQQKVGQQ